MKKSWYSFAIKAAGVLDISIHDEIGSWGVEASVFLAQLKDDLNEVEPTKVINLSIHSPGGNLLDGLAMYNALRAHPAKVYGRVEGIAASAASLVLMAADTISMPEDAWIMIHNPWTIAIGDAEEMRAVADLSEKMRDSMANIYERRTGMDRDELLAMMSEETWMTSVEALNAGFADNISDAIDVAAKVVAFERHFKQLPVQPDGDILQIESLNSVTDLENFLRDAGEFSRKAAKALVARSKALYERDARTEEDDATAIMEALNRIKVPGSLSGAD